MMAGSFLTEKRLFLVCCLLSVYASPLPVKRKLVNNNDGDDRIYYEPSDASQAHQYNGQRGDRNAPRYLTTDQYVAFSQQHHLSSSGQPKIVSHIVHQAPLPRLDESTRNYQRGPSKPNTEDFEIAISASSNPLTFKEKQRSPTLPTEAIKSTKVSLESKENQDGNDERLNEQNDLEESRDLSLQDSVENSSENREELESDDRKDPIVDSNLAEDSAKENQEAPETTPNPEGTDSTSDSSADKSTTESVGTATTLSNAQEETTPKSKYAGTMPRFGRAFGPIEPPFKSQPKDLNSEDASEITEENDNSATPNAPIPNEKEVPQHPFKDQGQRVDLPPIPSPQEIFPEQLSYGERIPSGQTGPSATKLDYRFAYDVSNAGRPPPPYIGFPGDELGPPQPPNNQENHGLIEGEFGFQGSDGVLRGVRYTAHPNVHPRLLYDTLVAFLAL